MCLGRKCCCAGLGVIEERMRKEGRGERRVGDEGGIDTSPVSAVSISMSVPKLKTEEVGVGMFRCGNSRGGSIDIVRSTGVADGRGCRRGDRVDLYDEIREEGSTADDARGMIDDRRIVGRPGAPFVVVFVFFGGLPNRNRFCFLIASSTSAILSVAASGKGEEVETDSCRRRFPFVVSAPPNQPRGAVTRLLMAFRTDDFWRVRGCAE
jgi:hypothetical protein